MASGASMDEIVDAATSGHGEDWSKILAVCDEVKESIGNGTKFLSIIWRRLKHQDPHIVLEAITLLNACVNNCGRTFHTLIASRDFETKFSGFLSQRKNDPLIQKQILSTLREWAEGDFSKDPQLHLIPSLYSRLRRDGSYPNDSLKVEKPVSVKKEAQEMDSDLAKAIELSLQEEKKKTPVPLNNANSSSLYPTAFLKNTPQPEGRKVRALYDFDDGQEGELSFKAGEIITILDETDQYWWKGSNQKGEGLLPSNFVTSDLTGENEQPKSETKRTVQFDEQIRVQNIVKEEVDIDEKKMDLLLHYLHEADPTDPSRDPPEMPDLAEEVNAMGPLIDTELERVDGKHAQLTQLCLDLQSALNMYHLLMRDQNQPGPTDLPKPLGHPYPMPPQTMNGPGPLAHAPGMIQNPYASMTHPPPPASMNGPPPPPSFIPDPAARIHNGAPVYGMPPGQVAPGHYSMAPMTLIPGTSAPLPHPHPSYHDKPPLL